MGRLSVAVLAGLAGVPTAAGFATSEGVTKTFAWSPASRSAEEAFDAAFPDSTWLDLTFDDAPSVTITRDRLLAFVKDDLLPNAAPASVPWPSESPGDQLGPGQWVAYSRRELCSIVAQSLVGAGTPGYDNGLLRHLEKPGAEGCLPRTGDFGRGLWVVLGACAADPGLAGAGQGPSLVVAKGLPPRDVAAAREAAQALPLTRAGLRVCQYDDGAAPLPGVPMVPADGCAPGMPGRDFMSGRGHMQGQVIQDISAAFFGGYIFGAACGLGGGQDERLMTYMPEVGALAFFLSQQWDRPQLRQPGWILGARMMFVGLDGTARFDTQMRRDSGVPLVRDLVTLDLGGRQLSVSSSNPFLAFMSENQGFLGWPEPAADTRNARLNADAKQRAVDASVPYSFEKQVRAWYSAASLDSYHADVRPGLRQLAKSLGSGPWLSGLWWGDSQLGFLAVWLGHALAASSWGADASPLPVDFYIYATFTENPGNQCLIHSADNCRKCLARCNAAPTTGYWLPDYAYMGTGNACVPATAQCGSKGVEHVVAAYASKNVGELWADVEAALRRDPGATRSVFDSLLTESMVVL